MSLVLHCILIYQLKLKLSKEINKFKFFIFINIK